METCSKYSKSNVKWILKLSQNKRYYIIKNKGGKNMNNIVKKAGAILLIVLMVMFALNTYVMALDPEQIAGQLTGSSSGAQTSVTNIGNQIIGVITTIGVVVAVVVLLVLGIKYMMGSASEKAEYKKTMIPYLVGAILIFGASAITKVVVSLGSNITA